MNVGWYPTYFTGDVGPINGQPDMRRAYESWRVHQARMAPTPGGDDFQFPPFVISPADRRNAGSKINAWDNRSLRSARSPKASSRGCG